IDEKASQLWAAVETAGVHFGLPPVDQGEVKIGNNDPFTGPQRFTHQFTKWRDNRSKAAAGNRANGTVGVFHELGLLIRVYPSSCVDDKATGLQCVLSDIDLGLLREEIAPE